MSSRTTNICILIVILLAILSGVTSLVAGAPSGRWLFWLHRIAGLSLVALAWWKWRIIARSYGKRGVTVSTLLSALFTLLVLGSIVTGVLWATSGFPELRVPVLGSLTGLGVHIAISVALIPLLLLHVVQRWQRVRRADFAGRRAAIRWAGLSAAGLALWGAGEAVAKVSGLSGANRRFTGSHERGHAPGNTFPSTNWFTDPKPRIEREAWSVVVRSRGGVREELRYADLIALEQATIRATLDCTGGWYTTQDWTGVPVSAILKRVAGNTAITTNSLNVRSATGYTRRFPMSEASELLLATHVGGEPLSRGHGAPARLVAPGYRGFEWVKWVVEIELSDEPAWLQAPLPLQ
jgi:DMSO/TMAO reductase YedYZ molybdopterin-dependent catalytic subunit